MGFRFRRSVKLFPGVRLNLSKSGASTSIGRRGAWLAFGPRGTRATVGIPGTGISYTETASNAAPVRAAPDVDVQHVLPAFDARAWPPAVADEKSAAEPEALSEDRALLIVLAGVVAVAVLFVLAFAVLW